jgi:hypothetical protein
MNSELLYASCIKMLNDKYNINEYSKEKFLNIYNITYKENNENPELPTNNINKLILIKIKNEIEMNIQQMNEKSNEKSNEKNKEIDMEKKLKEIELIRANMNLLSPVSDNQEIINDEIHQPIEKTINTIQINNQEPTMFNKFKTFIINTSKNNFKVITKIDINSNYIYPCFLCIPHDIKKITPYIILSINDGMNNNNYTYILEKTTDIWDIWKPITDNYINININSNNWHINLIDYLGNSIDFSKYYNEIIDVLENREEKTFSLSIKTNEEINYIKNNKIKIIQENGIINDNLIIRIDNNRLIIKKNNLELNDFINSKLFNYNNQLSLLFKYYVK